MLDLLNKFSVQPSTEIDYQSQVDYLFSTGKVAMILQGNWAYESIELIDKELAQTGIGFMPFPQGETKETATPVGAPMYWAFNNSKPEEVQKAAKDFINWLYLSEAGKKVIKEKFKFVPPYKGFSGDTVEDPLGKYILNQANAGKTTSWVFSAYPPGFAEKLGTDIQQYLKGTLSWDEVIRNAETSWADARK
jgi:raffinose/stachyose/melibiose transport system substrate-binding protein